MTCWFFEHTATQYIVVLWPVNVRARWGPSAAKRADQGSQGRQRWGDGRLFGRGGVGIVAGAQAGAGAADRRGDDGGGDGPETSLASWMRAAEPSAIRLAMGNSLSKAARSDWAEGRSNKTSSYSATIAVAIHGYQWWWWSEFYASGGRCSDLTRAGALQRCHRPRPGRLPAQGKTRVIQ